MHSDNNGAGNHAYLPDANHDQTSGSKRAELESFATLFQDVERPVAPPSLYEGLMAKIAVERAEQRNGNRVPVGSGAPARSGRQSVWRRAFADDLPARLAPLLVIVLGWCFTVLTMTPLPARVDGAVALARGVTGDVWHSVLQALGPALALIPSALSFIPSALEPVALGLMWGAIGWGVTVAVLAVTTKLSETM